MAWMWVLLVALACPVCLWLGIWPGRLFDVILLIVITVFLWGPFAVILLAAMLWYNRKRLGRLLPSFRQLVLIMILLASTFGLLVVGVPCRLAFAAARSDFERLVPDAPVSEYFGETVDRRAGLYRIDYYAADPRGGVYFRVHDSWAGGPDTLSCGFVHQPNPKGSPFGNACYQTFPLGDDWYWFTASSDW